MESQLIEAHVETIISKGFDQLVDGDRREDLKRLNTLLSRVNALDQLKAAWSKYIKVKFVIIF